MKPDMLAPMAVGLLPVATFLAVLLYLDSYKLVRLRTVIAIVACGAAAAVASYAINAVALAVFPLDLPTFSRYVAPVIEEFLKAAIIVVLIRMHRIGFLVDAAICGFAVGTGFAMVENLYYLYAIPDADAGTWIVRGFGTAVMHGGVTAIFAIMGLTLLDRARHASVVALLPGFVLAVALHSGYNHLSHWPRVAALAALVVLAPLLYAVYQRSEQAVGAWLGRGFDVDAEMLEMINSGRLTDSPVGQFLNTMKGTFRGPVVADLLCYLRIYTELALRAKGDLMMRESGFDVPVGDETRAKFEEMRFLEGSIGRTGLKALKPMLHMSPKDLWQLYMLGG
jgi:protease PrsW